MTWRDVSETLGWRLVGGRRVGLSREVWLEQLGTVTVAADGRPSGGGDAAIRELTSKLVWRLSSQSAGFTAPPPIVRPGAPRPHGFDVTLDSFATDLRVVRILVRKRLQLARRNRREHLLAGIAARSHFPIRDEICSLLPPRRVWNQFRPGRRQRRDSEDPRALLAENMVAYVMRCLADGVGHTWCHRLRSLIARVRRRILGFGSRDSVTHDLVRPIPKTRLEEGAKFRVLTEYSLAEQLIGSGFAAYLRSSVDPVLSSDLLSFRSRRPDGVVPSHHDGVEAVLEFAATVDPSAPVWVAECDIRGFYDAVDHGVVLRTLQSLLAAHGLDLDARLSHYLNAYLKHYDYESACDHARASLARRGIRAPRFSDIPGALNEISCRLQGRYGIPQGTFMSCVLANVVLHEADTAVRGVAPSERLLYMRYCDDILIASPERALVEDALQRYQAALVALRLPYHEPASFTTYGRGFWKHKSKQPYPWRQRADKGAVPWLSFLGYQISRDGTVRARRQSVQRELEKQERAVTKVLRLARRKFAKGGRIRSMPSAEYRIRQHLLALGVGFPPPHSFEPAPDSVSWCTGFRGLRCGSGVEGTFLKRLDQGRGRQLRRFRGEYSGISSKAFLFKTSSVLKGGEARRYDGPPFSYYKQFKS